MDDLPTVAICICTYRRPRWLAYLLESIDAQTFEGDPPTIDVIVVDNDPDFSARETVAGVGIRWPLRLVHEPRGGISHARNASVEAVAAGTEWIAFIDDDEYADPGWLGALLACQRAYGCDAVAGPVIAELPDGAPAWVARGGFFDRDRFETGTRRDRAYTNNTLVRAPILKSMAPAFDESRAFRGGEDTLLFRRIHALSHEIRWCDEAVVHERIPASRARAGWILRRAYRVGTNTALHERMLTGAAKGRARVLAVAAVRAAQGATLLLPSLFLGTHAVVRQLRWIAYAAGLFAGTIGLSYAEYRKNHHGG